MRYESLSYDELERLHTADPNNVNIAIALAAAAVKRIGELEGELEAVNRDHDKLLQSIRKLLDE